MGPKLPTSSIRKTTTTTYFSKELQPRESDPFVLIDFRGDNQAFPSPCSASFLRLVSSSKAKTIASNPPNMKKEGEERIRSIEGSFASYGFHRHGSLAEQANGASDSLLSTSKKAKERGQASDMTSEK